MNRIEKIKRIYIPLFIALIIILTVGGIIINKSNKKTGKGGQQASFDNIIPGTSNQKDVIDKLGEPVKSSSSSATPDEFKSLNPNKNNLVFYENGKVSLIKEIITYGEKRNISEIINKYGNPTYTLYGPDSSNGFNLYVYPDIGIAYLGNQSSGTLLEIWYFPSTNLSDFISNYAVGYSLSTKNIPQQ